MFKCIFNKNIQEDIIPSRLVYKTPWESYVAHVAKDSEGNVRFRNDGLPLVSLGNKLTNQNDVAQINYEHKNLGCVKKCANLSIGKEGESFFPKCSKEALEWREHAPSSIPGLSNILLLGCPKTCHFFYSVRKRKWINFSVGLWRKTKIILKETCHEIKSFMPKEVLFIVWLIVLLAIIPKAFNEALDVWERIRGAKMTLSTPNSKAPLTDSANENVDLNKASKKEENDVVIKSTK